MRGSCDFYLLWIVFCFDNELNFMLLFIILAAVEGCGQTGEEFFQKVREGQIIIYNFPHNYSWVML